MVPLQTAVRRWIALLAVLALFTIPLGPARHASAADASLVIAALHVAQEEYVDPVQPVPLLNAAIATLRKVTGRHRRRRKLNLPRCLPARRA